MNEEPHADLEDAAEFFRQGEESTYAGVASNRSDAEAPADEQDAFVEEDNAPDPDLVEQQLERRARYTRWVGSLMGALSIGCLAVFGSRWLGGDTELADAQGSSVDTLDAPSVPLVQEPTSRPQTIHSLRPAEAVAVAPAPKSTEVPPAASEDSKPPLEHAAPAPQVQPARLSLRRAAAVTASVSSPTRAPAAPQARPLAGRAIAPSLGSTLPSRQAFPPVVEQGTKPEAERAQLPVVVVSKDKTQSWNPDYRPPTAAFAD